jgi:hypothetical protein
MRYLFVASNLPSFGIFNERSRRTAAMRWTDTLFGPKRSQRRKGVEHRKPAAVWDDQMPGSLFQALGCIVNGQVIASPPVHSLLDPCAQFEQH